MFVVKTHRHMTGEPRQFVRDIYGPFAEWQSASDYANAFCHLWRDERATAEIECLYEPSDVILEIVARDRKAPQETAPGLLPSGSGYAWEPRQETLPPRVASSDEGRRLRMTWYRRQYGMRHVPLAANGVTFADPADERAFALAVNAGEFDTIADAD